MSACYLATFETKYVMFSITIGLKLVQEMLGGFSFSNSMRGRRNFYGHVDAQFEQLLSQSYHNKSHFLHDPVCLGVVAIYLSQ